MADPTDPPTTMPTDRRRSSLVGQNIADMLGAARSRHASQSDGNMSPSTFSGSIPTAAMQAHGRRLSLSTVGLGTSPTQTFANVGVHRDSTSSNNSGSIDEVAVEDDGFAPVQQAQSASHLARRMSFGARALRDVKTGNGSATSTARVNGRPSMSFPKSPVLQASSLAETGTTKTSGRDSFTWTDNFRMRRDRSASITLPRDLPTGTAFNRSQSISDESHTSPMSGPPKRAVPDAYSERILRGEVDF